MSSLAYITNTDETQQKDRKWPQKNKVFNRQNPPDFHGHSTHVAGIIGGSDDDLNLGIAEALTRKGLLKLIAYKVLDRTGRGWNADIIKGIQTANEESKALQEQGYFVIYNFSLGGQSVNSSFNTYLKQAEDAGVFVVAASGNDNQEFIGTPANGDNAHAIGSTDPNGERSGFSNYGPELYLGAPGARIFSTWLDNQYRELSGTSMATPTTAGVAAIIASMNPEVTNRQLSHFMRRHTEDLMDNGWDKFTGYGASIMEKWINGDPLKEVDQGNGNPNTPNFDPPDPPDPIEVERRKIIYVLDDQYHLHWKPLNETVYQNARSNLVVKLNSKYTVNDGSAKLKQESEYFFDQYGFWVSAGADMHDAGYWARYFYEKYMEDIGLDVEVTCMEVSNQVGTKIRISDRNRFAQGWKKIFKPEVRKLKLSTNVKKQIKSSLKGKN